MSSFSRGKGVLGRGPIQNQQKAGENISKALLGSTFTRDSAAQMATTNKAQSHENTASKSNTPGPSTEKALPKPTLSNVPTISTPFGSKPAAKPSPPSAPPIAKTATAVVKPPPRLQEAPTKPDLKKAAVPTEDPFACSLDEMDLGAIPDSVFEPPATQAASNSPVAPPLALVKPAPPVPPAPPALTPQHVQVAPPVAVVAKPKPVASVLTQVRLGGVPASPPAPTSAPPTPTPAPAVPVVAPPAKASAKSGGSMVKPAAKPPPPLASKSAPAASVAQPQASVHVGVTASTTESVAAAPVPQQPVTPAPPAPQQTPHMQPPRSPQQNAEVDRLRRELARRDEDARKELERLRAQIAFKDMELQTVEQHRLQLLQNPGASDDGGSNGTHTSAEESEMAEPKSRGVAGGGVLVPHAGPAFLLPLNSQQVPRGKSKRKGTAPVMVETSLTNTGGSATKRSRLAAEAASAAVSSDAAMAEATARDNEHLRQVLQGYKDRMRAVKRAVNGDFDQIMPNQQQAREAEMRDEMRRMLQEEIAPVRAAISSVSPPPSALKITQAQLPAVSADELEQLQRQCRQLTERCERLQEERAALEQGTSAEIQKLRDRVKQLEELTAQANDVMKQIDGDRQKALERETLSVTARQTAERELEAANSEKVSLLQRINNLEAQHEQQQRAAQADLARLRAEQQATSDALAEAKEAKRVLQEGHEDLANKLAELRSAKAADMQRIARAEKENEDLRTRVIVLEQRAEESRNSHRDLLARAASAERLHTETSERVKELTAARDAALAALEKRNGEFQQLQHENRSITEKLRESIVRELNAQEAVAAAAASAAAATVVSANASAAVVSAAVPLPLNATEGKTAEEVALPTRNNDGSG